MHIGEDVLEKYCMNKLSASVRTRIDAHLADCAPCRDRFETLMLFVDSMCAALRRSDPNVVHWELHATADGPFQIWVERTPEGKFLSLRRGKTYDGGRAFDVRITAVLDCVQSFRQLFPEHRCDHRCWS